MVFGFRIFIKFLALLTTKVFWTICSRLRPALFEVYYVTVGITTVVLPVFLDTYPPRGILLHMTHTKDTKSNKHRFIRRLKIIEGQVRGLQEMLNNNAYCIDVITQTSAVKQALSNVEDLLMENHLGTCIVHQIQEGQTKKATKEILKVYQLKRK